MRWYFDGSNARIVDKKIIDGKSHTVANLPYETKGENGCCYTESQLSHAKLIASAPAMLAAMQLFCDRVDKGEVKSTATYNSFKQIIKNATT